MLLLSKAPVAAATTESFNVSPSLGNGGSTNNSQAVTLGCTFSPKVNGHITALKLYKPSTAVGDLYTDTNTVHTLSLWNTAGSLRLIGPVNTSSEPAYGWVTAPVTPFAVTAGTDYNVSFWAAPPTGWIYITSVSDFTTLSNGPHLSISQALYLYTPTDDFPVDTYAGYFYADVDFVPASWSLIAHTGAASGTGTVTTPSIDTTGADLLIAVGANYTSGLQISDNKSNSWLAGPSLQLTSAGSELFYCQGGAVGPGHTFTWTGNYGAVTVAAFRGSAANPLDQSNAAAGVHNTGVVQPGAITPSQTSTLVVSGCTSNYAINSVDSGFIITDNSYLGSSMVTALAYFLPANVAALNPTWAITANSFDTIALIASFKGTS